MIIVYCVICVLVYYGTVQSGETVFHFFMYSDDKNDNNGHLKLSVRLFFIKC